MRLGDQWMNTIASLPSYGQLRGVFHTVSQNTIPQKVYEKERIGGDSHHYCQHLTYDRHLERLNRARLGEDRA